MARGRPKELTDPHAYTLMLEPEDIAWLKAKGTYRAAAVVRKLIQQQRTQESAQLQEGR